MAKPNTLPEWLSKYHTIKSGRSKMLYCTLEYLQEFGLTRLGFWGGGDIFVSCDDTAVQYNSEDEKIFSNLTPDFELDLSGGSYIGVIIAQEKLDNDESKLQVIKVPMFEDYVTMESMNSLDDGDFCLILEAIVKSIEFNKANNIPIEKWGVMHDASVNPYTLEYIG